MEGVLLLTTDAPEWPVIGVDDRLQDLTGFSAPELMGRPWPPLWPPGESPEALEVLRQAVLSRSIARVRFPTSRRDLPPFDSEVETVPIGGALVVLSIRAAGGLTSEEAYALALRDPLTGLASRPAFEREFAAALSRSIRERRRVAVLFVDLDRFKAVNDSLGHAAGDQVLRVVADRLAGAVRAHDLVSRFGGDEFVVALTDLDDAARARADVVVSHITRALRAPIDVDGRAVELDLSVGVSMFPDDADDGPALLQHADAGMYRVKAAGRDDSRPALFARAREAQHRAAALRSTTRETIEAARAQVRPRQ